MRIIYTIDKKEDNWNGEVGFIGKDMVLKYCDDVDADTTYVMTCGPPPMCEFLKPIIKSMGVKDENYHNF